MSPPPSERDEYPLQWPRSLPRQKSQTLSNYVSDTGHLRHELLEIVRQLGGHGLVATSDRISGTFSKSSQILLDTGVAAYFFVEGREYCMPCDRWDTIEHNVATIVSILKALHIAAHHGGPGLLHRLLLYFRMEFHTSHQRTAQPGRRPAPAEEAPWCWSVLGLEPTEDQAEIAKAYKRKAKTCHPDTGGTAAAFQELRRAFAEAKSNAGTMPKRPRRRDRK